MPGGGFCGGLTIGTPCAGVREPGTGTPAWGVRATTLRFGNGLPTAGVLVTITAGSGTSAGFGIAGIAIVGFGTVGIGFGITGMPALGVFESDGIAIVLVNGAGSGRGNGPAIDSTGTAPRAAAAPGAIGFG